jgi:hypothetical protein
MPTSVEINFPLSINTLGILTTSHTFVSIVPVNYRGVREYKEQ